MERNLWQTFLWGKFQKQIGRKTWFLKNTESQLLAIKHPLIFGYSWIDIPRGPLGEGIKCQKLIKELIQNTHNDDVVFIRCMPKKNCKKMKQKFKMYPAHANHHPETTLKINLTKSEEQILKQMKPKGRYNIRLAEKKGVTVKNSRDVNKFFKLIQETTERNQFWGHSQEYYRTMLEVFGQKSQLLLAKYQGEIIAGGIFIYQEKEGIYYYGASSNKYRNVMAPYLIQWKAIKEAKKRGCEQYDFLGISPAKSKKNHPWKGVTNFKKKFGGFIENYEPAQEIVLKPLQYKALVTMKKLKKLIK